jgi:sulfur carrier protein ThiS
MREKCTRKGTPPVKVYCLPDERAQLQANARAARKTVSTYLLNVGLGYQVRSATDGRRVDDLLRINADLGRLGGLLKLWLINDERTAFVGAATLRAVLAKIEATQDGVLEVVNEVLVPRAERDQF